MLRIVIISNNNLAIKQSNNNIIMKNRIGIVGGGQLARMMIFEAKKLGFFVTVLDPTPNSPAGQVADKQILASLDDPKAMKTLAERSDYLTIEWEHANPELLDILAKSGLSVNPSAKTLEIIKDKLVQKQFLTKYKIPVAPFMAVTTKEDIEKAATELGYPLVLKARIGGYDGKGNAVIKNKTQIDYALKKLQGKSLYVEGWVPFTKEVAVMVARNTKGEIKAHPVVETVHKNNICHTVFAPARVSPGILKKAEILGMEVMQVLKSAGIFGIEMFVTKQGKVLINEIAPRVHNSGHYSMDASLTNQFQQHIRAITGMPLGKTELITPAVVMINILGTRTGQSDVKGLEKALAIPGVYVHLYGKAETKIERKILFNQLVYFL
jgi:5-(carboxyamino)imidazole ribonucleotide synthase